jgi:hypothetical protein
MILPIIFLYVLPAILTVFLGIHMSNKVTVSDLIIIILTSMFPLINLFVGYVGGLVCLCETKAVNNFLNKRIK